MPGKRACMPKHASMHLRKSRTSHADGHAWGLCRGNAGGGGGGGRNSASEQRAGARRLELEV